MTAMTGANCTLLRASLVLLGFLAVMQRVPTCRSENQCYQLRLGGSADHAPCSPTFPDCPEGSLDTIQVTNATLTVNEHSVDATETANRIVHCNTYTCGSLAYFLLADYSTEYCLGDALVSTFSGFTFFHIKADVSVQYTVDNVPRNAFRATLSLMEGYFTNGQYWNNDASCAKFRIVSVMVTNTSLLRPPPNMPNQLMKTHSCSEDPTSTIETTDSNFVSPSEFQPKTSRGTTADPKTSFPRKTTYFTESPSTPEISKVLSTTHDFTTPSTPETSTAQPSTIGVNTPSASILTPAPGITNPLQLSTKVAAISTHITPPPLAPSLLSTALAPIQEIAPSSSHVTTAQQSSSQSCGNLVSEEISADELGGIQQCGSTFTFHFSSLNVTNVTVRYAYIPRDEISGNADDVQLASTDQEGSVVRVISTVIEINLLDGNTTIRLTDGSVDIIFKIDSTEDFPPNNDSSVVHCAYMVNESTWSTEGLRVVSVNSDSVVCHSSHLTSFAVLLSVKSPEGIHAKVQSYMSYLLGAISIASLTLAVLIYFVTGTYKILKIQIHMNLAIATALGQLLFLTMAESTWNRAVCKGVAVTLHYLFTAALAWTMIEGVFLYRTTAVGFKPLKIGWLSLIAWGSSLVVVGVSFGIKFDTYGQSNYCWLYAEDYTIYIFAACVFGTELFSFVVLWFVMRVFNSLKANQNKDGIDKFKATARALFIILPIIGLTWLAGTITSISASDDVILFQYIFIITFSLQGVCILVFHCLMVPDVKTAIKLRMNRRVADKSWSNSKSTKSTASSTL